MRSTTSWAVVVLAIVGLGSHARADPAALSLFDEGKRLYGAGRVGEACSKFAASLKLDAEDVGVRGMLALCLERQGRLASAWSEFRDVAVRAKHANRAKEAQIAADHIAELGPRLARVKIRKPSAMVDHLVVKKDGVVISQESFGVPLAVDRGAHTFSAEAPGFQSWSEDRLIDDGEEQTIKIPALDPAPAVQPAVQQEIASPRPPAAESNPWRIAFYGSVAVALVGVGLWVYGYHEIDDAELGLCSGVHTDCGHPVPTDPATIAQLNQEGNRGDNFSLAGKIATAVGGGFALVALYEGFFAKPRSHGHDLAVVPVGLGAALSGSW